MPESITDGVGYTSPIEAGQSLLVSGPAPGLSAQRKIWIDLDNSPHVPLFVPIIDELKKRGYSLMITARDCFQVGALADLSGLRYKRIGRHYGKSKTLKVVGLCTRSLQLLPTVLRERPHLALSHGSRSQILLCALLRVPSIVMFDYEFVRGLGIIHPSWAMAPEVIINSATAERHLPSERNLLGYPGIKEDVYVPRFRPDASIVTDLGLDCADLVVTVRPPAVEAHYHNPESEVLMGAVFEVASRIPNVKIILLPRNEKQELDIRASWPELFATDRLVVPDHVVDGLNLIWHSDLVISGGGTMNREAAALGVPVYSIFRGKPGAVDRYLAGKGRLTFIATTTDVDQKIVWKRRSRAAGANCGNTKVLSTIIDHIDFVARLSYGSRP